MEIRRWHYCIIFNCVIIKYLQAKTISLNDVITAESQQKQAFESILPSRPTDEQAKTISLNDVITAESQQKQAFESIFPTRPAEKKYLHLFPRPLVFKKDRRDRTDASSTKRYSLIQRLRTSPSRIIKNLESGFLRDHTLLGGNILSPLTYKKKYLNKSPLKPRKLKFIQQSRYKRKNQSRKREIHGNEELKQKYIPFLKSLSLLFDNLLNTDSSESYEVKTKKYKRNRFYSEETFEVPGRTHQSDTEFAAASEPQEETVTFAPSTTTSFSTTTQTPTTTEASPTTANHITTRDFSTFQRHKNIPILLPRNTFSGRGDDHGIGERSGATHHGNIEGNITRHHGDHEHDTGCGENESCAENDEENTDGTARDGARGSRLRRPTRSRNNTGILPRGNKTDTEITSETETTDDDNRENQFKTGRNETKSGRILQEPLRGLRGFIPDVNENTESVQSKEVREESVVNVTHDSAGYQRITDRGSPVAEENQEVRSGNEAMTTINNLNFTTSQLNAPKKKSPVMMIFDGYSIVKHKNGQNKFAEKSVRIHS